MLYSIGMNNRDFKKYFVGIGSMYYDINPCNKHLGRLQQIIESSLKNHSSIYPFKYNTIGVSDGLTNGNSGMNYSLPSREIIADSIETMIKAHHFDGHILIPGCDKNLPASIMAMGRINRPSILLYGGTMLPGNHNNKKVDIVDAFQSYGEYISEKLNKEEREKLLKSCCDYRGGSCSGMYTCNSMAIISEVIGLSPPQSSSNIAASNDKIKECSNVGSILLNLLENNIKPRDIVTRESLLNAIRISILMGGSTNVVLHLLAIANDFDIELSLKDFDKISNNTPVLGNLKPIGKYTMYDIYNHQNGFPSILKYFIDNKLINGDTMTITGKTLGENVSNFTSIENYQDIIYPINKPIKSTGHIRVMYGNLAPKGAIAKISGLEGDYFSGKAKVFNSEDDMIQSLENGEIKEGMVVVIRYQGPKGGIGMPELLKPSSALVGAGLSDKVALITDGRWSGGSKGFIIGHITPEAYEKGLLAIIEDNDIININANDNKIDVILDKKEIKNRFEKFQMPKFKNHTSYLRKYQKLVYDASSGCTTFQ